MRKSLAVSSLFVGAVIVLAGFTPVLASKPGAVIETIPIEVTRYFGGTPLQSQTLVTPAAAEQIRTLLTQLATAQDRQDTRTAAACIQALQKLNIDVGPQYTTLMQQRTTFNRLGSLPTPFTHAVLDDNLSNSMCYFNAIGQGMLYGMLLQNLIESIQAFLKNQTNPFLAVILLLVFIPLIVVFILFNDIIPIRILMPHGTLVLANGTISSLGLQGFKREKIGANYTQVNISGFTGIALNIPPINNHKPFAFISGIALKVEAVNTTA